MRFIIVKDDLGNSVILDTVFDLVIGTIANQEMAELLVAGMNLNIKMPFAPSSFGSFSYHRKSFW